MVVGCFDDMSGGWHRFGAGIVPEVGLCRFLGL
jgi:hypothetical protein